MSNLRQDRPKTSRSGFGRSVAAGKMKEAIINKLMVDGEWKIDDF